VDLTGLKGFARCTSLSQIFFSALTHYVRGGEKNFSKSRCYVQ
jgi:hypothetical protein